MKTRIRSDWARTVLVCGKCSKKLRGGFGPRGRTSLAKALRELIGAKKGRKSPFGIVEVKCLGVCPKRAVTVVDGTHPREWMLVAEGADIVAVAQQLELLPSLPPIEVSENQTP